MIPTDIERHRSSDHALNANNPDKFTGLKGHGLAVAGRVPVLTLITKKTRRYLETKRTEMGHAYGSDLQEPLAGFTSPDVNNTGLGRRTTKY